jgi:DnaJ-class molecular chaperone
VGVHENKKACGTCGGKGTITYNLDNKEETKTCTACDGTGKA